MSHWPELCVNRNLSTIYLGGDINWKSAYAFRITFKKLEAIGKKITVEINSQGGDISQGLMIIDTIRNSKVKVITRAVGEVCSMASIVLASGHEREALQNCTIMLHRGDCSAKGDLESFKSDVKEILRLEILTADLLNKLTKKRRGFWESQYKDKNLYMNAETALRYKLIDRIVKND